MPRPAESKRSGIRRFGQKSRNNGFLSASASNQPTDGMSSAANAIGEPPKTTFRRVGPLKRTTSSPSVNQSPPQASNSKQSASTSTSGSRLVADTPPEGDPKDIGTVSSPIWNHSATFDVVAPGRTILLCVYDKLAPQGGLPAHGFLGATVFEPPLSAETGEDGEGLDLWLPSVWLFGLCLVAPADPEH